MKVCISSQGHMTKMATMAINNKNVLSLLQNQKAYDFETWHEASRNGGLRQGQLRSPMHLNGENCQNVI